MKKKVLYINCDSGLSGDMFLGAMVDMGVPSYYLQDRLSLLYFTGFSLIFGSKTINNIKATDVDVLLDDESNLTIDPYSGDYRNYGQVRKLIENSGLSEQEKALSLKIFEIKAEAEAEVHGVQKDQVKFHEAGAVDSIVDIVGAAICICYMNADKVISKKVPTGYGHIICACGKLPVPAPAVRQILENTNIPYYRSNIKQELLTPTGASIVAGIADEFRNDEVKGRRLAIGYGTGKRDTGLPPLEVAIIAC